MIEFQIYDYLEDHKLTWLDDLPIVNKSPSMDQLLNANYDTNVPYNQNSFPSFDPYNQNVGTMTQHDSQGPNPQLELPFR